MLIFQDNQVIFQRKKSAQILCALVGSVVFFAGLYGVLSAIYPPWRGTNSPSALYQSLMLTLLGVPIGIWMLSNAADYRLVLDGSTNHYAETIRFLGLAKSKTGPITDFSRVEIIRVESKGIECVLYLLWQKRPLWRIWLGNYRHYSDACYDMERVTQATGIPQKTYKVL